jgi:hypothetical protein
MESTLIILGLITLYLIARKIIVSVAQAYLDSFFDDPTGGIVPLDGQVSKTKRN